jgi:hypothetical protein
MNETHWRIDLQLPDGLTIAIEFQPIPESHIGSRLYIVTSVRCAKNLEIVILIGATFVQRDDVVHVEPVRILGEPTAHGAVRMVAPDPQSPCHALVTAQAAIRVVEALGCHDQTGLPDM